MISLRSKKMTASGQAYTGACVLGAMIIGTDGVNDPEITVFDGTDNTGVEKVPTTTYDASVLGLNGFTGVLFEFYSGIYVEISCAGSVEVVFHYKNRDSLRIF